MEIYVNQEIQGCEELIKCMEQENIHVFGNAYLRCDILIGLDACIMYFVLAFWLICLPHETMIVSRILKT